nr:MAG TPA: hypothetical protein [Caudoviricetes sp.]
MRTNKFPEKLLLKTSVTSVTNTCYITVVYII